MERRSRLLIEIVAIVLAFSLTLTFFRTIILKDFYIVPVEEGSGDELAE